MNYGTYRSTPVERYAGDVLGKVAGLNLQRGTEAGRRGLKAWSDLRDARLEMQAQEGVNNTLQQGANISGLIGAGSSLLGGFLGGGGGSSSGGGFGGLSFRDTAKLDLGFSPSSSVPNYSGFFRS